MTREPLRVMQDMLQILEEGSFVATYKYAVLLGLIDACVARPGAEVVTSRQLANHVIALYWPQVRVHVGRVLTQNSGRQAKIVQQVHTFAVQNEGVPLVRARTQAQWQGLLDDVEHTLIEMPLPKLQRIRGETVETLFHINWTDTPAPTAREVRRPDFDNRILLLPGVGDALIQLAPLLRPFIQHQWAQKVAKLNALPEAELPEFLFGPTRGDLVPLRDGLADVQGGRCFYCDGRLGKAFEVDHFLPWSRVPSDDLANLVAADRECNNDKRDYLADIEHLVRWRRRQEAALADFADRMQWSFVPQAALLSARALYAPLTPDSRLWTGRKQWASADRERLKQALQ